MHEELEKKIGYTFNNKEILREALIHPSKRYKIANHFLGNQRLEFLGDAVLQMILSEELFHKFPMEDEGTLTKLRARLVSKNALEKFAININLGKYLEMSYSEIKSGGKTKANNIADAFEALLASIYLDSSYENTKKILFNIIQNEFEIVINDPEDKNPKGVLQEILQEISSITPVYIKKCCKGPEHDPMYEYDVMWMGEFLGCGKGKNKKEASMNAASNALELKIWEKNKQ